MNETIEIIKEARKAGMQTALMLFGALLVVSALFGYYIYKSYPLINAEWDGQVCMTMEKLLTYIDKEFLKIN
jgi:hypothetical protein